MLKSGLLRLLHDGELRWLQDRRDLLVAMAPYHDCARRLELDPAAFGFRLVMSPEGATYEWDR